MLAKREISNIKVISKLVEPFETASDSNITFTYIKNFQGNTSQWLFLPSWIKRLQTFPCFSIIFLHHKWNGTRLVSPENPSRVAKSLKTKDLRELGNFKKIFKTLGFNDEHPADHPRAKFWHVLIKYCKKISSRTCHSKTYVA